MPNPRTTGGPLRIIGPGLLVAATGVGAGDLATAGLAGSHLGETILWVVVLGALLKLVLNENLARWQIATGQTVLEGALIETGRIGQGIFLIYLLPWSFVVGSALMAACGVTLHAMLPIFDDANRAKIIFGGACSIVGLVLTRVGGFRLFERVMGVCVLMMFATVVITAIAIGPDWGGVARGLVVPVVPDGDGRTLAIGLMGGVGGTLTILCYSYWMREEDRRDASSIPIIRLDLVVAYGVTALFGIAMIIIASGIELDARGAALIPNLADRLAERLGPAARWVFLIGAFGAVFSSLLGVWQAVPYIFADFVGIVRRRPGPVSTTDPCYRWFMVALATIPMLQLGRSFKTIQLTYAVIGALFIPVLAVTLLYLNNKRGRMGKLRNRWLANLLLAGTVALFALDAVTRILDKL